MKRTHRELLVLNWAVTFQDHDNIEYYEYKQLKSLLSRRELVELYHRVKAGHPMLVVNNTKVHAVQGV